MLKKFVAIFCIYFVVSNKALCEEYFKYEPYYSYLIKVGISHLINPINEQVYIELTNQNNQDVADEACYKYSNLYTFSPNVCFAAEYRVLNNILGLGGLLGYSNRKFGVYDKFRLCKIIYNNYHLDYGLNLVLYPKGSGGLCFYSGIKFYTKIKATRTNLNADNEKIIGKSINKEVVAKLEKISNMSNNNYGVFGGFKLEIDRTGFIFGFEMEKFLKPMNTYDKQFDEYKLSAVRFNLFFGFDFARLYSGYFT